MMVGHWPVTLQWLLLLGGSVIIARLMEVSQIPAALMLGPLIWGAVLAMRGATVRIGRVPHQFGQAVAGTLIATNLDPQVLTRTLDLWPVVLVFVILTLILACAVGICAARLTGLDREVTVWGFLPGMAGTMIALAHERGIDSRMVAFIQILRLLMVIGAMVGVGALLAGAAVPHNSGMPPSDIGSTLGALALSVVGIAAARWMPIVPAGASLVPLLIGGALCTNGINLASPHWLIALAYLVLGAQVGLRFTPQMVRTGARALPMLSVAVILLLLLCGASGAFLSLVAGVDPMSAMLATVPGSIDSIALIALSTGSDISFIMTLQTVRMFAVVLLGPPLARSLLHLASRRKLPTAGDA